MENLKIYLKQDNVFLINQVQEIIGHVVILNMAHSIERRLKRKFDRQQKDAIAYKASFFCIP
jgi:hypothetical protein